MHERVPAPGGNLAHTQRAARIGWMLLAAFALLHAAWVHGQTPLATYDGADRLERIVEGAKREGKLLIYTSMPVDDMREIAAAFKARHGIEVSVWRASSEKVVTRIIAEARAGRFDADIVETGGTDLEALFRERLLQPVRSPRHADLMAEAVPPGAGWVGTRVSIFVQAYNTALVKPAELPRRWEDLLDPRWKGRLAIEAEDAEWLSGVVGALGEARGLALFRAIVATNGVSVRKGHSQLAQLVAAGEIPLALTVYDYKALQLKHQGAPVEWFAIPPAIAKINGLGVPMRPKNPHAALLFYEFALGREGQQILLRRNYVPTRKDIETPQKAMPLRFIDAKAALDADSARWEALFGGIFRSGSR